MRHATWLRIEASPLTHGIYRRYRRLPEGLRRPLRTLATPRWHLAAHLVRRAAGDRIVAGPFRGMRIALSPLSSRHLLGYLLGSTELELHEAFDRVFGGDYRTVLNVGAADGYYTVGLALRLPHARIEAFEALPDFHPVIARAAAANGVENRVAIAGLCTVEILRDRLAAAQQPTLILMDVEGNEITLLDPEAVPGLTHSDILVETHDAFVPDVTQTLMARFGDTHDIACYAARPRRLSDFPGDFLPGLRRWLPQTAVELMNERRTGTQRWLALWSRAAARSAPAAARDAAA